MQVINSALLMICTQNYKFIPIRCQTRWTTHCRVYMSKSTSPYDSLLCSKIRPLASPHRHHSLPPFKSTL